MKHLSKMIGAFLLLTKSANLALKITKISHYQNERQFFYKIVGDEFIDKREV